jgi:DNA-binding MarR family transcriptional regulator
MSDNSQFFALEEHLCFALYGASMAITRAYKPILSRLGITYPQYLVLMVLWGRNSNSPQAAGAISEQLSLDPGTVSPLLKRLDLAGLLTRQRNPHDERQVLIQLTDKGIALRAQAACLSSALLAASGMTASRVGAINLEVKAFRDAVSTGVYEHVEPDPN